MQESRFQRSQSRFVETSRASRPGLALRVEGREDGRVGRLAVDEHGVGRDGGDVVEGPLIEPVLDEVGVEEAMRVRLPDVEVWRGSCRKRRWETSCGASPCSAATRASSAL